MCGLGAIYSVFRYFVGIEGPVFVGTLWVLKERFFARILGVSKDLSMRSLDGVQASRSSHITYLPNGCRESTPPQNCQLIVLIRNGKQLVDDFVGELTF